MPLIAYLKYQFVCLVRSQNLVSIFLTIALQTTSILMLWKYRHFYALHESVTVAISALLAMGAITASSNNLLAWHYNSTFLLFVSPTKILRRISTILGLLYNLFIIGLIDVIILGKLQQNFTWEKQMLVIICLFTALVMSVSESFIASLYHALPIKKNAFSFGETTPKPQGGLPPKIILSVCSLLIPIIVFYSIGQYFRMFWVVFVIAYALILLGWLWKQIQSLPQQAYAARFQLYQSLKG